MPLAHGLYSVGILVGAVTAGLAQPRSRPRIDPACGDDRDRRDSGTPRHRPRACAVDRRSAWAADRASAAPDRARRPGRLHRRGRDRELERDLPRAPAHAQPAVSGLGPGVFGGSMAAGPLLRTGDAIRRPDTARRRRRAGSGRLHDRRDRGEPGGRAGRVRTGRCGDLAERADRLRRRRASRRERGRDRDHARLRRATDRAAARRRARASVLRSASRSPCSPWSRPP